MRLTTRWIREEYGYTQKELSKEYNIPLATIKNWDARRTMPNYIAYMIIKCEILKSEVKNEREKKYEYFNKKEVN